jgi:tetratricopeptide (TPR) repeat protein
MIAGIGVLWFSGHKEPPVVLLASTPTPTAEDEAKAALDRGNAAIEKKEYDKAISDYTEAIRLKPDAADAYYNRGIAYDDKNEHDKAISDYTEAIRLKPDAASAYYNRGLAFREKSDYDKAISD